jgi:ATP-dependent Lon protease
MSKQDNTTKANTDEIITSLPKEAVIVPIINSPIFPGMIAPIILSQDKYTPELDKVLAKSGYLALNLVKFKDFGESLSEVNSSDSAEEYDDEEPTYHEYAGSDTPVDDVSSKDIYKVGVLCKVVKKLKLPDGSVNVLVHGLKRYRVKNFIAESPLLIASVEVFEDIQEADEELDAYTRSIINQVKKLSEINPYFNEEMKLAMLNSPSPGSLADLVAFALSLDIPEAQDFLETLVVKKRFAKLLVYLKREKDVADIQKKITDEVNNKVNKYQREYFLREQLKVIRSELGLDEDDKSKDLKKITEAIEAANMPEDALKAAKEELERLENIPDSSPEYNVSRTYLNWMISLPWDKTSKEKLDINFAKKTLEKDHYGLEKAKSRILEFLAVRKLKPEYDGTILCFAGPPGVGKTSLGQSIANALGRKFYRFSLGGMRDEAEIKGHRKTYVGAMPGKIIQTLKRVEVNNPVIMLDEIDKLGKSYQGDPASALLEVLDPEQNKTFIDNYLDVPFDLSKVLFIATANYIGEIPEALLDRMELIEVSGYTIEEKISIATKWVIPKLLDKHGLTKKDFNLSAATIKKLIADYAREPGVRVMEQTIAKLCRITALEKVSSKRHKIFSPKPEDLEKHLGSKRFQSEVAQKPLEPGVVTGLAWTAYGGEILFVESIPLKGKGFKLTGQLGDVMNESANLAYSYIKRVLQKEMIKEGEDYLAEHEVHLHLPAGATPKDGPSAGITMALALYSLAKNKKIRSTLAMTGELSLTGKVLPVGGIKEKVLAAKRAGIKEIIIPDDNAKDLKDVPERHRKGIKFYPVKYFTEVLKIALK